MWLPVRSTTSSEVADSHLSLLSSTRIPQTTNLVLETLNRRADRRFAPSMTDTNKTTSTKAVLRNASNASLKRKNTANQQILTGTAYHDHEGVASIEDKRKRNEGHVARAFVTIFRWTQTIQFALVTTFFPSTKHRLPNQT